MEEKKVCILGAARNIESFLPSVLPNLDTVASWWKESKIVIFENDSTDKTAEMLHQWVAEKGGNREIVQDSGVDIRIPGRTDRLAYVRNRLLHYVPPGFDYVFMVDLDDQFAAPVQRESFECCFRLNGWDVMTAMRHKGYYDIWALRVPGLFEKDCWQEVYRLKHNGFQHWEAVDVAIHRPIAFMNQVKEPLVVNSAFNVGMLMKVSALRSCCRYVGNMNGYEACEHVSFQNCLRSHGARIVFNPDFKL